MNPADLTQILDVLPSSTRTITLPNGKEVAVSGIPLSDYVRIVRRFPHLLNLYLAPVNVARENVGKEIDAEAAKRDVGQRIVSSLIDADMDDQDAADTAFIAAGLGLAHNVDAEKVIATYPFETRDALLDAVEEMTYGGDQSRFFGQVVRALVGRTLRRVLAAAAS